MKTFVAIGLLIGIAVVSWLFFYFNQPQSAIEKRVANAETSIAYKLKEKKWLTFPLPKHTSSIKIVANANLPARLAIKPDDQWRYEIEYQLLKDDGSIITTNRYHLLATVNLYHDPRFKKPITASFYLDPNLLPTDGTVIRLNLQKYPEASAIRMRLKNHDPMIQSAIIRMYVQEHVPGYKKFLLWQRMSQEKKEKLVKDFVLPASLLTQTQIQNLLSSLNKPIGPSGMQGQDYVTKTLYVSKDAPDNIISRPVLPQGLLVDEVVNGIIPLPKGKNKICLQLYSAGLGYDPPQGSTIVVRWRDRTAFEFQQFTLTWRGEPLQWEHTLPRGQLEIMAQGQLIVRAYQMNAQPVEITPKPLYLRAYESQNQSEVLYKIHHVNSKPTLFRVDFRLLSSSDNQVPSAINVHYDLLDKNKNIIRSGLLRVDPNENESFLSPYERVAKEPFNPRVTTPVSYFFSLAPSVKAVRFASEKRVLIRSYNRPYDMVRQLKIPEAYYLFFDDLDVRQPAWFALKPENHEALRLNDRSILLTTQVKPSDIKWPVLAGQYIWQDFHPIGNWQGQYLLTPMDGFKRLRDEALPNVFKAIPSNQTVAVHLREIANATSVHTKIAYMRSNPKSAPFSVFVDGSMYYKGYAMGLAGEILLPPLKTGQHRFHIEGDAYTTFYVNHVTTSQDAKLRRLVNQLNMSGLTFHYEKKTTSEEIVSFRYYVPFGTQKRSKLSVRVQANRKKSNPLRQWSFLERTFDIQPNLKTQIPIIGKSNQTVDEGRLFTVPLGEDIPPGIYTIHVKLEEGVPGYLLVSRLLPGMVSQYNVFVEPEVKHVQYH